MALYDAEENGPTSMLYDRIENYAKSGILKHFWLNLIEFLSLPSDYTLQLFKVAEKLTHKESDVASAVEKKLADLQNLDKKK